MTTATVEHPRGQRVPANDFYNATCQYLDLVTLEKHGDKKSGRLGRMVFEFETADKLNLNRRIYPKEVFLAALMLFQGRVDSNAVFSRLDHPDMFDSNGNVVTLKDAATKIVSAKMKGDTVVEIVMDILDNEDGARLVSILGVGGNPGVSQRAFAIWRDPTPEERERYGIPEDEMVDVAEALRLITYDVVSEPGFVDANQATVSESKQGDPQMADPIKTTADLKTQFPTIHAAVHAEGVESTKEASATAVTEAVTPLNASIETLTGERNGAVEALKAIKPALVKLGIVNEKVTDADAATKIATLTSENKQVTEKNEALQKRVDAMEAVESGRKTTDRLRELLKDSPHADLIIERVEARKPKDMSEALELAAGEVKFIESIAPAKDAKDTKDNSDESKELVNNTRILQNFAGSNGSSDGKADETDNKKKTPKEAACESMMSGIPGVG